MTTIIGIVFILSSLDSFLVRKPFEQFINWKLSFKLRREAQQACRDHEQH